MYKGKTSIYKVKNPIKYKGDFNNVVARSNLERRFMVWADNSPSVIEWGSEEVIIPYINELDNRYHRYFVDFFLKVKDVKGNITKYLIEIKPEKFTLPPKKQNNKQTKNYISEVIQYSTNTNKWKAAENYCNERGMKFLVLVEKDLGIE